MKQAIFAACSLHRYLVSEVANFVMLNEELCAEAVGEVKDYLAFIKRQQELNKKASQAAAKRITNILAKHHPDLAPGGESPLKSLGTD